MRLWTALQGWAALIAVSVALYALGLTLEVEHKDYGHRLILISIAFGTFASVIFAGDLIFLGYGHVSRTLAQRKPPFELGDLDYVPEFHKATNDMSEALAQINEAMQANASLMTSKADQLRKETDAAKRQVLALEIANGIDEFRKVLAANAPRLEEKSNVARYALNGYVKQSKEGRAEFLDLKTKLVGLRAATKLSQSSAKDLHKVTRWLHGLNRSSAINRATQQLEESLKQHRKALERADRNWASTVRTVNRKLMTFLVRRLVPRRAAHRPG